MTKPKQTTAATPIAPVEHSTPVAYIGLRTMASGDYATAFVVLTPDEYTARDAPLDVASDRVILYDVTMLRAFKGCRPGAIFLASFNGTSIQYTKHARPVAFIRDGVRIHWSARNSATESARDALATLRTEGARNLVREQCDPLRAAYRSLGHTSRAQLLAEIVAYVVKV